MAAIATMIEAREVVGHFETREVVGGSPTDILYVLRWSPLFFLRETFNIIGNY